MTDPSKRKRAVSRAFTFLFALWTFLTACTMPVVETLNTAIEQQLFGVVQLLDRPNGSLLATTSDIRLGFTRGLKESSLSFGGELGQASSVTVTASNGDGVTEVRLSPPETGWSQGTSQALTVDGDTGSRAIRRTTLQFDVSGPVLHVSAERGRFTGTGTVQRPYNSLERALDVADAEFTGEEAVEIRLTAGLHTFGETGSASAEGILIPEGYAVIGGYSEDFAALNAEGNRTILRSASAESHTAVTLRSARLENINVETVRGASALPLLIEGDSRVNRVSIEHDTGAAVLVREGGLTQITNARLVSAAAGGVVDLENAALIIADSKIEALANNGQAKALDVTGAAVELQRSTVFAHAAQRTIAVEAEFSTLNLFDTELRLGSGGEEMWGIDTFDSNLLMVRSSLALGTGNTTVGIDALNANIEVVNSVIDAAGDLRAAIEASDGEVVIRTSTIGADTSGSTTSLITLTALDADQSSITAFVQNVILHMRGSDGGHVLRTDSPGATTLENTVLHAPGADALMRIESGGTWTNHTTIGAGEAIINGEGGTASGNLSIDPVFEDAGLLYDGANWRLTAGSPISVTEGGIDGSTRDWNIGFDVNGNERTVPWSIGAYEYD